MIRTIVFLLSVLVPLPSFAANLPVTFAVKNSVGETIMYAPTTTYTKTIDSAIGAQTFTSQATEISAAAVVADKLQRIGYRPDDPRVGTTIEAIQVQAANVAAGTASNAAMGAAGAVVLAAVSGTPITWGLIGAAALAGVVSGLAAELVSGGLKFLFGPDGLLTPTTATSIAPGGATFSSGGGMWCVADGPPRWCANDSTSAALAVIPNVTSCTSGSVNSLGQLTAWPVCTISIDCSVSQQYFPTQCPTSTTTGATYQAQVLAGYFSSSYLTANGVKQCTAPMVWGDGACMSLPTKAPAPVTAKSAVDSMPAADKAKPVSDKLLAQQIQDLWQDAAAKNPSILPPQSITPTDVAGVRAQNPAIWPMGDNLSAQPSNFLPVASPSPSATVVPSAPGASVAPGPQGVVVLPNASTGTGTGTSTSPSTSTTTTTTTTTPTGTSTTVNNTVVQQLDLGPDPATPAPTLESTPTAQMILDPVLKLMPDMKSYTVPSHASACPKPSMTLWSKTLPLEGHCVLLDSVAPTLHVVMIAVWFVVGLFIVLAA